MVHYVLTDGRGLYIRHDNFTGKYVPVRNETLAKEFDQRSKAMNILKNAISKKDRKRFFVKEVDDGLGLAPKTETTVKEINNSEKALNLHMDEVKKISELSLGDTQIEKWQDGISKLAGFVQESEDRRSELSEALSNVDKEITDIEHYIELNNLNAYQGFMSYKMLQNRLKRRRKIKDELQVLNQLGSCKLDSVVMTEIQEALKQMENKVYTPRVLTDLFK